MADAPSSTGPTTTLSAAAYARLRIAYLAGLPDSQPLAGGPWLDNGIERFFAGYLPGIYADSISGSDSNAGTSPPLAVGTIAQAESILGVDDDLYLVRDSNWLEMLTGQANGTYLPHGTSGGLPLLDGADVIDKATFAASAHVDAGGVTYEVTLSRDPSGVYVSGDTYMMWQDGDWLLRKLSVADVAATPGTFYLPQPNALATASLAYVHPLGSTNPISDASVYEASKRSTGFEGTAINGATVTGIHCTRGMSAYGPLTGGRDMVINRCLASKGGKHNLIIKSGTVTDTICFDAEIGRGILPDGGLIPFTFYQPDASGLTFSLINSMCIAPVGRKIASAVYNHGSSGSPGHHSKGTVKRFASVRGGGISGVLTTHEVTDSFFDDVTTSISISASSTVATCNRNMIRAGASTGSRSSILHPSAGATTGGTVEIAHNGVVEPVTVTGGSALGLNVASIYNVHHNTILSQGNAGFVTFAANTVGNQLKNNIFVMDKTGSAVWGVIGSNVASDFNVFINVTGNYDYWWQTPGSGTAGSLTEWRSESGQDLNSIELNAAGANALFLYGLAGLLDGDFRLNPASTLMFADGTTPVVGNAGVQEYYDWSDNTVKAGQPSRWPVPPNTLAECDTYCQDPSSWNFYP
ncbi:MAG: hypothetical protein WBD31_13340 [Rubripirellula sp.]